LLGGYKGSNGLGPQGGFWKKAALPGTPLPRALHCLSLALAAISGYAEPPGTGNVDFAVDVPAMLKGDGSTGYVSSVESVDGRLMLTLSTGARVDVSEVSFQNAEAAEIFKAAMGYDTDTAAALIVYYEGDIPSDVYTEAFQNLYEGGKAGLSFSKAAAGNAYSEYLSDGAAEAAYQAGQAAYEAGQGGTSDNDVIGFGQDGESGEYDAGNQTEAKNNVLAFGESGEATSDQNNPSVPVGQSLSVDEQNGYNEGETAGAKEEQNPDKFASEKETTENSAALPSEIAKNWQGAGKYPGVDKYEDIVIKQGKVIYRGEPNGTEYFTTKSAIERSGHIENVIFEGLQVEKNLIHGYRSNMQGYKATVDLDVAFGIAKANPQFGKGGLPQIFIPNADDLINKGYLIPAENIPLIKVEENPNGK